MHNDQRESIICLVCGHGLLTIQANEIICTECNFRQPAIYSIQDFERNVQRLKSNYSDGCEGTVRFLNLFEISDPQQKFCMICENCKKIYIIM